MTLINRYLLLTLTLLSLFLLQGCSPHPGAGSWLPAENSDAPFSEITVDFNGRVEIFVPQREGHIYRCFWAGIDSNTLKFDCISADDETLKPQYTFRVTERGVAELLEANKSMGHYVHNKDQSRYAKDPSSAD
ncbi:MAG: hypothetical protein L3J28_00390 [Candidatus Polarisedimenticolaceae bacterium]|nr:hypothetical protein [Candidatus Polarisedimenticolaceae bacterium]